MKKELSLTVLLFVIFEVISLPMHFILKAILIAIGFMVINMWVVYSLSKNSSRKISKFSQILVDLNIHKRWYTYLFVPLALYFCIVSLMFIIRIEALKQFFILISSSCFFALFYFSEKSFEKAFYIEKNVRIVIDVIGVILFFLLGVLFATSGVFEIYKIMILYGLFTITFLVGSAFNANLLDSKLVIFAVLSGLIIAILAEYFGHLPYLLYPFVMTLFYYLIISFWHLRMIGENKLEKYFTPVIFVLMSLIVVLS